MSSGDASSKRNTSPTISSHNPHASPPPRTTRSVSDASDLKRWTLDVNASALHIKSHGPRGTHSPDATKRIGHDVTRQTTRGRSAARSVRARSSATTVISSASAG